MEQSSSSSIFISSSAVVAPTEKEASGSSLPAWKHTESSSVFALASSYAVPLRVMALGVMAMLLVAIGLSLVGAHQVIAELDFASSGVWGGEGEVSDPDGLGGLSVEDEQAITVRNLFNKEGSMGSVTGPSSQRASMGSFVSEADNIPVTSLPYKLVGTVSGSDPYSGIATILHTEQKSTNVFFVGDYLMDNVFIHQILYKKVIISNQGALESLAQEEFKIERRRRGSPLDGMSSFVEKKVPVQSEGRLSQFKEEGFEFRDQKIKMTASYKKKLLTQDFARVLQDAKADPYIDPVTKKVEGFRLTRIRKDSIYEKSGLANGDIVKEINGIKLTAAPQAISVLQQVRNESRIEVTVQQDGVIRVLEIDAGL